MVMDACKWASQDAAAGASAHSLAPTVRRHSTVPAWTTAEGCPERVRGAGPSPPRRRYIMAPNYRWRSHRCRDRLCTRLRHPLRPRCGIQGGDFQPAGGGVFELASEGTWRLSPSFPLPICLFLFLASLAWRCGVCGTPGMRACCVRRSGCRREGLRAVLTAVSAYKNREKCCPDCAAGCVWNVQSTRQHPFSHTPSPWTHTHVDTLHAHVQPVSQKVLLAREGKGSRVGEGSWGARDGVESTPRCVLEQRFYPRF